MVIPFILHWPSLFFSKVSNLQKKVLLTTDLFFPNYCITYLPRDISRDFKKVEHVNLRGELTCVVFELYNAANNQKIADRNKVDYQEGLEKSCVDSAAQSCDSYMKDLDKSHARSCKSYMKYPEKSHADSAARSHEIYEKDLRRVTKMKLTWLYPTKVRKQLQS